MNEKTMTEEQHFSEVIAEESICTNENLVFERTETLIDTPMHYCPGCGHGVAHRLIAEVIDELGIQDKTVGVAPVGCSVFIFPLYTAGQICSNGSIVSLIGSKRNK